jgi:hypothetical protein
VGVRWKGRLQSVEGGGGWIVSDMVFNDLVMGCI